MCDAQADHIKELSEVAAAAMAENRRLIEKVNRLSEILRMKDELINKQVQRIMHLEGVRG